MHFTRRAAIAFLVLAAAAAPDLGLHTGLAAQNRPAAPMTEAALRARIERYAADSMRGRLTGTPDNVKATRYIADELRALGLRPAGDDGGFLQRVPLSRMTFDSASSSVTLGGRVLRPYAEYLPRNQGPNARPFDGVPIVYAGVWGDTARLLGGEAVRGKVVLLATPLDDYSVVKLAAQARFAEAAGIVIANFDLIPRDVFEAISTAPVQPAGGGAPTPVLPSYLHISVADGARLLGVPSLHAAAPGTEAPAPLRGSIAFRAAPVEAYNVVAILLGSDPVLRDEYVAVGAHNDHVGTGPVQDKDSVLAFNRELRAKQLIAGTPVTQELFNSVRVNMDSIRRLQPTPRLDSIYNGADDDASGSMGVLEVARAFAMQRERPKRSIIFVWHTGEELGLFGSAHFTDHPTVPREKIVAQLNLDMIGRGKPGDERDGGPDYLQLIGSRRLSTQLGDIVEKVSTDGKFNWRFDYQYDANGHPEQYYCRSDHFMYARYGIPIVFMSTGGHAEYHQVTDEIDLLDFAKLSKVARFTHALATGVAHGPKPVVDKPVTGPRGQCVQ
jgi:hypothetical protein